MKIFYSLEPSWFNPIKFNFAWGTRHIALACTSRVDISLLQRIGHFVLGLLLCIPVLGRAIAGIEYLIHIYSKVAVVHLTGKTPYEMGKMHGELLKEEIKEIYPAVLAKIQKDWEWKKQCLPEAEKLESLLSNDLKQELRGLAEGSGQDYDDVLRVNLFPDVYGSDIFACSATGVVQENGRRMHVVATNHFRDQSIDPFKDSNLRYLSLDKAEDQNNPRFELKQRLKNVNREHTVQSLIFDTSKGKISIARSETFASSANYFSYSPFTNVGQPASKKVKLARNFDFSFPVLSQTTTLFVRHFQDGTESAVVGWPGFIGAVSGSNNHGLALAVCASGKETETATANFPFLQKLLRDCKTTKEALASMRQHSFASCMNVTLVGRDAIAAVEIDLSRKAHGIAAEDVKAID